MKTKRIHSSRLTTTKLAVTHLHQISSLLDARKERERYAQQMAFETTLKIDSGSSSERQYLHTILRSINKQKKLRDFSPHANYTDRATAAYLRSYTVTRHRIPKTVILIFSSWEPQVSSESRRHIPKSLISEREREREREPERRKDLCLTLEVPRLEYVDFYRNWYIWHLTFVGIRPIFFYLVGWDLTPIRSLLQVP
jgi:hypothetical protein